MPPHNSPDTFHSSPVAPNFSGRDRVLLYTRGMNLAPSRGVTLALRSMRRARENAPAARVMRELFLALQENDVSFITTIDGKTPIVSTPPINRRAMIAEDMVQLSLTGALKSWLLAFYKKKRKEGGEP